MKIMTAIFILAIFVSQAVEAGERFDYMKEIDAASRRLSIPREIILSIIFVESRGNPWALNINGKGYFPHNPDQALKILSQSDSNVDIGLMQINYRTWGIPLKLSKFKLLDVNTNILLGTLILRHYIDKEGHFWKGVGRYNSTIQWKKYAYSSRVHKIFNILRNNKF